MFVLQAKTAYDIIAQIKERLIKRHADTVEQEQDAWWILQAITRKSQAELIASTHIDLDADQQHTLHEWLVLHVDKYMPLQYLLGSVPFAGLNITVKPPILIPRQETEEWVLQLIETLKHVRPLRILDLGAGSGCIAVALAYHLSHAAVYTVDINTDALELTRLNARTHNATVHTYTSDFFTNIPPDMHFDLIVSNPPYISLAQWPTLDHGVTHWEDKHALLAGKDGLDAFRIICAQAKSYIELNADRFPQLVLEIGYTQAQAVKELLVAGGFTRIEIKKDLEGKDRVIYAGV